MGSDRDCFSNSLESFAWWDQDTLSWRTSQRCLIEEWATLSEPWPRSGMTASGTAFRLPPLVRPIDATECSLFATPTATANQLAPSMIKKNRGCRNIWPTPVANDGNKMPSGSLARAVRPELQQSFRKNEARRERLKNVPTPLASDSKGSPKNRYLGSKKYRGNLKEWCRSSPSSGQLNPTWTEWLMGFPLGWTDLDV